MKVIHDFLEEVRLGEPQVFKNLTLHPLLKDSDTVADYRLLDEAIEQKIAHVTEVSEEGSVPDLKFVNEGPHKVLLLDGEELVGAKQNRILNVSVMAPAQQTITIPVSCVEAGRWHRRSHAFSSAYRAHFARGRRRNAEAVTVSMSAYGSRRGDQSRTWDEIDKKFDRMNVATVTSASEDLYMESRASLDDYASGFSSVSNQIGALFSINGIVSGGDLFDSSSTMSATLPKLVDSYAMDAIDTGLPQDDIEENLDPGSFLSRISKANVQRFDGVGLGEDYRFDVSQVLGSALVVDGRVVHLCAFPAMVATSQPAIRHSRISRSRSQRHDVV